MNELVHRQPPQMALQDKLTYAEKLAASGLIPDAYKRNPPNVLVAVEKGEALGIHPIMALEEINVINGRASLSATLMASLARSAGHIVRTTSEPEQATCTVIRKDDPKFEHKVTWTRQMAEDHGLWGKGHWRKNAALMLEYRAISQAIRKACPEVLAGIKYTPEELVDIAEEDRPEPTPQPAPSAPSPEPAKDAAADRLTAIWDDPAAIDSALPWLRSNRPELAEKAAARLTEFEAADNTETEGQTSIEDAEIVGEDHE